MVVGTYVLVARWRIDLGHWLNVSSSTASLTPAMAARRCTTATEMADDMIFGNRETTHMSPKT